MEPASTPASNASGEPSPENLLSAYHSSAAGIAEPDVNVALSVRWRPDVRADGVAIDSRRPSTPAHIAEELRRRKPTLDTALEHRKQIDGLRFFAFLAVFLVHSDITRFWWGSYGVSLFFVISGFFITRILIAYENRPRGQVFRSFYARRVVADLSRLLSRTGIGGSNGRHCLPASLCAIRDELGYFFLYVDPARTCGHCVGSDADVRHPLLVVVCRRAVLSGLPAVVFFPAAGTCEAFLAACSVGQLDRRSFPLRRVPSQGGVWADSTGLRRISGRGCSGCRGACRYLGHRRKGTRRRSSMDVSGRSCAGSGCILAVQARHTLDRPRDAPATHANAARAWVSGDGGRIVADGESLACLVSSATHHFASLAGSATAFI